METLSAASPNTIPHRHVDGSTESSPSLRSANPAMSQGHTTRPLHESGPSMTKHPHASGLPQQRTATETQSAGFRSYMPAPVRNSQESNVSVTSSNDSAPGMQTASSNVSQATFDTDLTSPTSQSSSQDRLNRIAEGWSPRDGIRTLAAASNSRQPRTPTPDEKERAHMSPSMLGSPMSIATPINGAKRTANGVVKSYGGVLDSPAEVGSARTRRAESTSSNGSKASEVSTVCGLPTMCTSKLIAVTGRRSAQDPSRIRNGQGPARVGTQEHRRSRTARLPSLSTGASSQITKRHTSFPYLSPVRSQTRLKRPHKRHRAPLNERTLRPGQPTKHCTFSCHHDRPHTLTTLKTALRLLPLHLVQQSTSTNLNTPPRPSPRSRHPSNPPPRPQQPLYPTPPPPPPILNLSTTNPPLPLAGSEATTNAPPTARHAAYADADAAGRARRHGRAHVDGESGEHQVSAKCT